MAVLIDVSDDKVIERLSGRRACVCGETYHIVYNPPRVKDMCDKCGAKLQFREDDKPETIKNRLSVYHELSEPLMDYFEARKQLIKIDGEQEIEKVFKNLESELEKAGVI